MKSSTIMRLIVRNRKLINELQSKIQKCSRLIEICEDISSSLGVADKCNTSLYVIRRNCKKALAKAVQDQVELKRELTRQQTREWVRKQIYGDAK